LILGDAAADTLALNATITGATPLSFEGATANGFETSFAFTDPTADRTITFGDSSLTVNAAADISGTTLASNVVTSSLTTVGALGSGSIGTGFGTINNAAAITGTVLTATTNFTMGDTVVTDGVITDTSGLSIAAAVDLGSNTLTSTGSLQVRTIDYTDGDLAMTIADGGGVTFAQNATFSGIIDVTDTTDASDATGDTGALRTEGGASIAKKLYVGTDLDVDGTAELDNITIGGAQGSDGQVLTSTGSGVGWEDAGGGGGITHASQWRLNSGSSGSTGYDPLVNWEAADTDGAGTIGTAMTYSSGVFSFPTTGIWLVEFCASVYANGTTITTLECYIETTVDNSTYTSAARGRNGIFAINAASNTYTSFVFDVTDVSTHKVQFEISNLPTNAIVNASTSRNQTWATFTRLGDT